MHLTSTLQASAVAFVVACGTSGCARPDSPAARFPSKPISIVCWSNPGSPNDLLARQIAKVGGKYFGQSMTVLTKAGGNGANAMAFLTKQKGDGHTLSTLTSSQIINMASGVLPFSEDQFTYIMRIQVDPFLIAVRADSPFRTLGALFDHARLNPGKVSVAGFGTASAHFLAFSILKAKAGNPDMRWIAYEGGNDAVVAGLGGHIDAVHTNYSAVREHVKAGRMRVLGVSSTERHRMLPDVATYIEQGYDLAPVQWRGVMGPPGISPDVVAQIRSRLEKTIADPEFRQFIENAGEEFAPPEQADLFRQAIARELKADHQLLRDLHLLTTS